MSSYTTKGNVSVVDSWATDWNQELGNIYDPGKTIFSKSSNYKANDDWDPCRAGEVGQLRDCTGNATSSGKLYNTRYFIIKSLNHQNIQLSIEKGIWATQVMNEPILEEAFCSSDKVVLIFSVNMSGFFQGYAQMMSSVGWRQDNLWSQVRGKCNPWGHSFKVKWLRLNDLPFQKTLHLKNPLNDFKPVKISRDCQELSSDIGEALCELLDGKSHVGGLQTRECLQPLSALENEAYIAPPVHPSWSQSPMLYCSTLYQQQTDSSTYQLASQRSSGIIFPEKLPVKSASSKVTKMRQSHLNGCLSSSRVDRVVYPQANEWGLYTESSLAGDLTEDDFLEMSYEEYLEFHSRSHKGSCPPRDAITNNHLKPLDLQVIPLKSDGESKRGERESRTILRERRRDVNRGKDASKFQEVSESSQTSQGSSRSRKRDDDLSPDVGTDQPCSKNRVHCSSSSHK